MIELRPQIIDGLIEMRKEELAQYMNKATESNQTVFLLDQHCFDLFLRAILGSNKVQEFYVACGFVYASGIKMLRSEIDKLLADGVSVKILAGNLQHYFSDRPLTQMDLETAQVLNQLITAGAELKTITDSFYHGKMYIIVCDNITFVVAGSTNISRNAIEYFEKKMVVLESFYPGNAYFVFYDSPVDQLLDTIDGKSKTEIFKLSGMEKRGYHIREQLKLEVKIASCFV